MKIYIAIFQNFEAIDLLQDFVKNSYSFQLYFVK